MISVPGFEATTSGWLSLVSCLAIGLLLVVLGGRKALFPAATIGGLLSIAALVWAGPGLAQSMQDLAAKVQARADAARVDAALLVAETEPQRASFAAQAKALADGNTAVLLKGFGLLEDSEFRGGTAMADLQAPPRDGMVYIAVSFSMPPDDLRRLAREANAAGATLVIRGLVDGSFKKTLEASKAVFDEASPNGLAIDPQVFRAYRIEQVPTFISARAPVEPCGNGLDCVSAQPQSDRLVGNISLREALKILSERGREAPDVAAAARRRMEG